MSHDTPDSSATPETPDASGSPLRLAADATSWGDMPAEDRVRLSQLISHKRGLIVVTGGTGTGKTTLLDHLAVDIKRIDFGVRKREKIIALLPEDEVRDFRVAKVTRYGDVDADHLADVVRASFTLNPDVLLVDEIRSPAVLEAILDAASTVLVVATVHSTGAQVMHRLGRLAEQTSEPETSTALLTERTLGVIEAYNPKQDFERAVDAMRRARLERERQEQVDEGRDLEDDSETSPTTPAATSPAAPTAATDQGAATAPRPKSNNTSHRKKLAREFAAASGRGYQEALRIVTAAAEAGRLPTPLDVEGRKAALAELLAFEPQGPVDRPGEMPASPTAAPATDATDTETDTDTAPASPPEKELVSSWPVLATRPQQVPEESKPARKPVRGRRLPRRRPSAKKRSMVLTQLATLVDCGIPSDVALETTRNDWTGDMAARIDSALHSHRNGTSLAESLRETEFVGNAGAALISAQAMAGMTSSGLQRAAEMTLKLG